MLQQGIHFRGVGVSFRVVIRIIKEVDRLETRSNHVYSIDPEPSCHGLYIFCELSDDQQSVPEIHPRFRYKASAMAWVIIKSGYMIKPKGYSNRLPILLKLVLHKDHVPAAS